MRSSYLIICILFYLIIEIKSKKTTIIPTTNGLIQGEILKTVINHIEYSAFKGIPYAEPPVGYLRFKPPIPKKKWIGVLKTTIEGANCVQKDYVNKGRYTGSENCLFLNIYSPKTDFKNLKSNALVPVMVWIHGGGYKTGSGNSSLFGPDFLIEDGVVLVTFNYRLGPLGFLNLNHQNATGNAGLKDQNLVLRWVNKNIAKFGGDPHNITIFGQSSGGSSVILHILSDMSYGLFHRSISMSASPYCPWAFHTPKSAIKQAFMLGKKLGKVTSNKEELLKILYKTSAIELMKKTEEIGKVEMDVTPFRPSIENITVSKGQNIFLSECGLSKFISGKFNKVPHLGGFTANETVIFAKKLITIVEFENFISTLISKVSTLVPFSSSVVSKLFSSIDYKIKDFLNTAISSIINETSDLFFVAGIDLNQRLLHAFSGRPVYYYRLAYDTEQPLHKQVYDIQINGTAHGDDLAYLFHTTVANISLNPNDPVFITRQKITRLWTNFAKYGNPTPDGKRDDILQGITWPDMGSSTRYLNIDQSLTVQEKPSSKVAEYFTLLQLLILPIHGCYGDIH